ncbi:MAG: hypothetical protein IT365_13490 [Candidatus Hydrogenedentes bacterium]|nr:hypothetical protein [Candidatus Hydrogenedentota bacterium]
MSRKRQGECLSRRQGVLLLRAVLFAALLVCGLPLAAQEATAPAEAAPAEAAPEEAAPEEAPPAEAAPAEAAPEAAAPASETEETAAAGKWFSGRFQSGFDGTWSSSESDIDLDQSLQLNLDPPGHKNLHFRSLFWAREDLDSDDERWNTLRDLDDNYSSEVDIRPVYLYMDIDDLWGDSTLRIGRQRVLEGPAFNRFDGVYFKQRQTRWDWYVFGGWQASLYSGSFEDPVAGGGASVQLSAKTRVAVDLYWEEDEADYEDRYIRNRLSNLLYRDYPREVDEERDNTRGSFSIWQTITSNLTLFGRVDIYDGGGDELTLQATGYVPSWKLTYQATYRKLMSSVDDRSSDLTGFYRILGPEHPYDDILLVLHRPLTPKLGLSLEGQVHRVEDEYPDFWLRAYDHDYDYADRANRDYNRVAVILSATDLFWDLSASASFQVWDVEGRDASWSVGGDVTKKWEDLSLTLGAHYERYEDEYTVYNFWPSWKNSIRRAFASLSSNSSSTVYYDSNFMVRLRDVTPIETNDDIYSIFTKLRWAFRDNQDISLAVSYEQDDSADSPYWRVRAGYTLEF